MGYRPLPCHYSRATRDAVVKLKITLATQRSQLGDPRIIKLQRYVEVIAEQIFEMDNELQAACLEVTKDPYFEDMRTGKIPYPMEPLGAFVPKCDCSDACNACSDKVPQYLDPAGDAVGRIMHTCTQPCPIHGFEPWE